MAVRCELPCSYRGRYVCFWTRKRLSKMSLCSTTSAAGVATRSSICMRRLRTGFGPTGGDKMTGTTFIQRVNTVGGLAPTTGCAQATDVGKKALVPYQAEYVFYRERN